MKNDFLFFLVLLSLLTPTTPRPANMQYISSLVTPRPSTLPPVSYGHNNHPFDRHLESLPYNPSNFKPLRMTFDYSNLETPSNMQSPEQKLRIKALKEEILPGMASHWSTVLSVIPAQGEIPIQEKECFGFINVPTGKKFEGTDLVVFVAGFKEIGGAPFCVKDSGTLAAAAACNLDQYDRPIVGFMNFCLDEMKIDPSTNTITPHEIHNSVSVAIHEIAHVLGVNSEQLKFFRNPLTGEPLTPRPFHGQSFTCLNGQRYSDILRPACNTLQEGLTSRGTRYFEVVTPTVQTVVTNHFNCPTLTGARLENQPTNEYDCFGSHWDERLFYTETLSAFYSPEANYFSPLTLALLEDSGWYKANYTSTQISPFGHVAGCPFVEKDCIVDGKVPSYSRGFFCNQTLEVYSEDNVQFDYLCDPSYTHKAGCDLVNHGTTSLPRHAQYFRDENIGTILFDRADHCPVALYETIDCQNEKNQFDSNVPGEFFGAESKCFESTSSKGRMALCLRATCNEERNVLEVDVNGEIFVCDEDYGVKKFNSNGMEFQFECPRFSAACPDLFCPANCSGRGTCDYDGKDPKCVCFDKKDQTPDCSQTLIQQPKSYEDVECSGSSILRFSFGGVKEMLIFSAMTVAVLGSY